MTTDITNREEPQCSNAYVQLLLTELKDSTNAYDIARGLLEQGRSDGLPNEVIRKDIEIALAGVIKPRQLSNILPLELKRSRRL